MATAPNIAAELNTVAPCVDVEITLVLKSMIMLQKSIEFRTHIKTLRVIARGCGKRY
jgi:hypothetical protein